MAYRGLEHRWNLPVHFFGSAFDGDWRLLEEREFEREMLFDRLASI